MKIAAKVLMFVISVACAFGLSPDKLISQYHKRHWQVEDGLPRNYVMSVLPSPDGYLLVATDEGLTRFDGVRFSAFDLDTSLQLSRRWVLTMMVARDGSLWVGAFDGGIYHVRNGKVVGRFEAGDSVFHLLEDAAGNVWASTRGGVIMTVRTGAERCEFVRVAGLKRPLDTSWNVLARDMRDGVWIVTADGLFHWRGGEIALVASNNSSCGTILSVYADADGRVWAGTSIGLFELEGRTGSARLVKRAGIDAPVVSLLRDRDGTLWAGTWGHGLYRVRGHHVDSWSAQDGGGDEFIRTLFEDREGNLWIGTRTGGLWRWVDGPVIPFGMSEGLAGNFASTVAPSPDGSLWFGTWRGGLYRFRNGAFESQTTPTPTLYSTVRALAVDRRGNPWIGNWEGLFGYDGKRYRHYFEPGSPRYHVAAIAFDHAGRLWVGTAGNGLFLFRGGKPVEEEAISFLPGAEITSLLEDSSGRVWVGTTKGAGWLDGNAVPVYHGLAQRPAQHVASITEDSRQRVWGATPIGTLRLLSAARPVELGLKNGLPGWPLYRILDDHAGAYWVSSARGILQIPVAQVDEVLAGRRQRLDVSTFDQEDGMRTIECHGLSQPAGWQDPQGGVWFPTTRGFVYVQPYSQRALTPPVVRLEEVTVDGVPVAVGGSLQLAPDTRSFDIRYTAFHFASAQKIRFRYRMEGFDPNWIEAGTERNARYSRLPPGNYRFLVSARMPGAAWSRTLAVLSIRQLPQFHQTGLFWALVALVLLAIAGAVFRWRVLIIKSRYAAVLSERNRIAREWHDTLLAGFAAISWQLDETLSCIKEAPERALETVEMALKMVKHYRAEARRVIWDMRENRPESETLADAVTSSLRQFGGASDSGCQVRVKGQIIHLSEEVERNVLRICQEAVSNAKRHGQARHIEVLLEYLDGELRVSIRDDGKGFEPKEFSGVASGHFGLAVMQERAQRFGGRLRLESHLGQGSTVEAAIPYEQQRTRD